MDNIKDLRERLVGRRYYDKQQDEGFTVVGITSAPPMALLQYNDGVAWDEGAANFTFGEDVAHMANLDEDGLDSDRYRQLGPGPRLDQICEPEEHDWFPWPDDIWQSIPSNDSNEQVPTPSRDFYSRIARCKRCGLSGSVAGQFGDYLKRGVHYPPWFCYECGEAYSEHELHYIGDLPYCPECAAGKNEKTNE